MPAFNARFEMKKWGGIPVVAIASFAIAVMLGLFAMATWGTLFGYPLAAGAVVGAFLAIALLAVGEERPFIQYRLITLRDMNALTSDAVETE